MKGGDDAVPMSSEKWLIYLMRQKGVTDAENRWVREGIERAIFYADLSTLMRVRDRGVYRELGSYIKDLSGVLTEHKSVDWYVEEGRERSKLAGHLNGNAIVNALRAIPDREKTPRLDVLVLREPMHWYDESTRTVIGLGPLNVGAVISFHELRMSGKSPDELRFWTHRIVLHELGHALGLYLGPFFGKETDDELKQLHCQCDDCVMQAFLGNPGNYGDIMLRPYCPTCLGRLRLNPIV